MQLSLPMTKAIAVLSAKENGDGNQLVFKWRDVARDTIMAESVAIKNLRATNFPYQIMRTIRDNNFADANVSQDNTKNDKKETDN